MYGSFAGEIIMISSFLKCFYLRLCDSEPLPKRGELITIITVILVCKEKSM